MVECVLCNQELGRITETHLWHKHKMHFPEFRSRFPDVAIGGMPWKRGDTKRTNRSLLRLSNTLKTKRKWNFSKWQKQRKKQEYRKLSKDENLAELTGIVLGDGNLSNHPRTENLRITCNSSDVKYVKHITGLIARAFCKAPSVRKRNDENAISIDLYQGEISIRLGLPCGNKIKNDVGIPRWILLNKRYAVKCLKGLFETDGCFHEDRGNYTRCIEFKNSCARLRKDTHELLKRLGFNPQLGNNYVRLARKNEVSSFKKQIDFRNYS